MPAQLCWSIPLIHHLHLFYEYKIADLLQLRLSNCSYSSLQRLCICALSTSLELQQMLFAWAGRPCCHYCNMFGQQVRAEATAAATKEVEAQKKEIEHRREEVRLAQDRATQAQQEASKQANLLALQAADLDQRSAGLAKLEVCQHVAHFVTVFCTVWGMFLARCRQRQASIFRLLSPSQSNISCAGASLRETPQTAVLSFPFSF